MNELDVLWTTDPGWVALGILPVAFVLLIVAHLTKYNVVFVVLDIIAWIAAAVAIGAVLGFYDLPGPLGFFNVGDPIL